MRERERERDERERESVWCNRSLSDLSAQSLCFHSEACQTASLSLVFSSCVGEANIS